MLFTPAGVDVVHEFQGRFRDGRNLVLYFKRGNVCIKQVDGCQETIENRFKIEIIRDVWKERFSQILFVAFPQSTVRIAPYFLALAVVTNAGQKSVLRHDGTCVPLTKGLWIRLVGRLASSFLRLGMVLPVVLVNVTVVLLLCCLIDLHIFMKSRLRQASD